MAELGGAASGTCPIVAGQLPGKGFAVEARAGQHVMGVRSVPSSIHWSSFFRERIFFPQLVVVAVQVVHALCNDNALGVLPWPFANAVACIDGWLIRRCARTQVGAPSFAAGPDRRRKSLADRVSSGEPAQICAVPRTGACDEETH